MGELNRDPRYVAPGSVPLGDNEILVTPRFADVDIGRAEVLFGKWMKDSRIPRDKIEIGGKFGYDWYSDPGEPGGHRERKQDFSPAFLRTAFDRSLARLRESG